MSNPLTIINLLIGGGILAFYAYTMLEHTGAIR